MLQGKREILTNCRKVEDSQEYDYIQNQRFEVDWKVSEINDVISDFDFFEELFKRHQESLWRKFKQVSVRKSHLFQKIIKIKLTTPDFLECFYS